MALRTVLITGANSGVGYATAKALADAEEGYHVLVTGRNLDAIKEAASTLNASKANPTSQLTPLHLDVTNDTSIATAVSFVEKTFGSLDVLINNAAVGGLSQDLRTGMTNTFNTNILGPALVSEAFRPLLLKSKNPYSLYISSGAGSLSRTDETRKITFPGEVAYRTSKAALNMLAICENVEYGPKGLKIFIVSPGFVVSNLRGKDEELRTGWGKAEPAEASGAFNLAILRGERDKDVGKFVHKDRGVHSW
jgi:NAD(P)-dependent dehydrogenase (short-subunit alcohol dehydrogenase family)